jgi:hypothetical protein
MQAVIVYCVPIIDPQLATIIRDDTKSVVARPENSQAACPTHSKVVTSREPGPFATCVAIIHNLPPTSHVWAATVEVLAATTLTEVKGIFSEETIAINRAMASTSPTCAHDSPSVSSIRTMVPEKHAGVTTTLKHLKSDQGPPSTHMRPGLSIAPAMQAIVVDCVPVVDPQLASIIRDNAKIIMACLENSHAACPAHSKVIASGKTRPSATCVPIVDSVPPSGNVRPAPI